MIGIIVTELCPGGTLSSLLKKPELNIEIFLKVIKALLELVEEMNKAKLVHRNLKPKNIIFTSNM